MIPQDIQVESDYRWQERAGILAGDRKELTALEREIANKEANEFENKERAKLTYENSADI
jgi:hypothetical protein